MTKRSNHSRFNNFLLIVSRVVDVAESATGGERSRSVGERRIVGCNLGVGNSLSSVHFGSSNVGDVRAAAEHCLSITFLSRHQAMSWSDLRVWEAGVKHRGVASQAAIVTNGGVRTGDAKIPRRHEYGYADKAELQKSA